MPTTEMNVTAANVTHVKAQPSKAQPSAPVPPFGLGPFRTLERFADEVTRIFDDFGLGRGWGRVPNGGDVMTWAPRVDVTQHKDEVVVRVDLPGMGR
ncbi:MAG TPA: hypothetical protein VGK32_10330, partial [Vicinamibacterales bacterium]